MLNAVKRLYCVQHVQSEEFTYPAEMLRQAQHDRSSLTFNAQFLIPNPSTCRAAMRVNTAFSTK